MMHEWEKLLIFSIIISFANGILDTFVGMYLIDVTRSYLMLALAVVLPNVMAISSKIWGLISDYYGTRKRFIVIGATLSSAVWLVLVFSLSPQGVILVSSIGAALWGIGEPAYYAAILEGTSEKGKRMGIYNAASIGLLTLGTLISGTLYDLLGGRALVAFASALFLLATLYVAVAYKEVGSRRKGCKLKSYLRRNFTFTLVREPELRILNISMLVGDVISSAAYPILWGRYYRIVNYNHEVYSLVRAVSIGAASIASLGMGFFVDKAGGYLSYLASQASAIPLMYIYANSEDPLLLALLLMIPLGLLKYIALYKLYTDVCGEIAGDAIGTVNTISRLAALPGTYLASLADVYGELLVLESFALFKGVAVLIALLCPRGREDKNASSSSERPFEAH